MGKRYSILLLIGALLFVASGCAKKEVARCITPEDNPPHHYLMGMNALEQGKVDVAKEKFERATFCEKKFSPAYSGLAIVLSQKTKMQTYTGFAKVEADRVFENLKLAKEYFKSEEDKFDYQVAAIRVHTALKDKDWLEKAEDAFNDGNKLKVDERKLIYYQGNQLLHGACIP